MHSTRKRSDMSQHPAVPGYNPRIQEYAIIGYKRAYISGSHTLSDGILGAVRLSEGLPYFDTFGGRL